MKDSSFGSGFEVHTLPGRQPERLGTLYVVPTRFLELLADRWLCSFAGLEFPPELEAEMDRLETQVHCLRNIS